MRYIGVRLNSVETAMLKEVKKKHKEFRNIETLIKKIIIKEYENLGLK